MKKFLLSLAAVMSMSVVANAATITETITVDNFGFTAAITYKDVEYTSSTTGITYKGNMCKADSKNGEGMQFRTTSKKEAGLVATANPNGYSIVSVKVTPSTTASTTNQWDVYGNATAYTTFKDLYDTTKAGSLIGSGTKEATVTSNEGLAFFGFRANKAAIYINSIVITYETGGASLEPANLKFSESEVTLTIGDAFTAPTLTKDTDAAVTYTSSTPEVATVNATTGAVEILAVGTTTITATAEKNDKYTGGTASYTITVNRVVETATFNKVTTITSDKKYVMVADGKVATQVPEKGYGYINVEDATGDASVTVDVLNAITIAAVDGGYTLQDASGRYIYQTGTFNSFNAAATLPAEGGIWTIAFEADGSAKITNVSTGKYIQYSANYTSYGCYADEQGSLPALYELAGSSAITDITVDENAPVEYFNLQGIRVENPENGLYIRRQGNKVTKVLVK